MLHHGLRELRVRSSVVRQVGLMWIPVVRHVGWLRWCWRTEFSQACRRELQSSKCLLVLFLDMTCSLLDPQYVHEDNGGGLDYGKQQR